MMQVSTMILPPHVSMIPGLRTDLLEALGKVKVEQHVAKTCFELDDCGILPAGNEPMVGDLVARSSVISW